MRCSFQPIYLHGKTVLSMKTTASNTAKGRWLILFVFGRNGDLHTLVIRSSQQNKQIIFQTFKTKPELKPHFGTNTSFASVALQ
jgi:hypothetical protein